MLNGDKTETLFTKLAATSIGCSARALNLLRSILSTSLSEITTPDTFGDLE